MIENQVDFLKNHKKESYHINRYVPKMGEFFPLLSTFLIFWNEYVCTNDGAGGKCLITTLKWKLQCIRNHRHTDLGEMFEDDLGPRAVIIRCITVLTICWAFSMWGSTWIPNALSNLIVITTQWDWFQLRIRLYKLQSVRIQNLNLCFQVGGGGTTGV